MPRAATTSDAFNAIAEPRRRRIIDALAARERTGSAPCDVSELVESLGLPQPTVSKHLSVLRRVGIVSVVRHGRHRVYRLNAQELKPMHDWISTFERFWDHQLGRIKERAERRAKE